MRAGGRPDGNTTALQGANYTHLRHPGLFTAKPGLPDPGYSPSNQVPPYAINEGILVAQRICFFYEDFIHAYCQGSHV